MQNLPEPMPWLLVSITSSGAAQSLRMFVWRHLRGLGALYLQQSVSLLPATPETERAVATLLDRVHRDGGQGRSLHVSTTDPAETAALIRQVQDVVEAEYADLLERLPSFFAELETETARGRATFAEVEENETDLERFRSWAAKIASRDYFAAPSSELVRAELARAAEALAAFETLAAAREAPDTGA